MEIVKKIKELEQVREKLDQVETLQKQLKAKKIELETEIQNEAQINMVDKITVDGSDFKIYMDTDYFEVETKSDHSKKVDLLGRLDEMGYGEKIKYFKSGYLHRSTMKKILNNLPIETIQQFIKDGILSVVRVPKVERKK